MITITTKAIKTLVLASVFFLVGVGFNVNAQSFTLNPATTDAAQLQYVNGELKIDYSAADFSVDPATTYYWFITDGNPFVLADWQESIIGTSTNANAVLTYNWPESGTYDVYIAGVQGDFDSQEVLLSDVGFTTAGTHDQVVEDGLYFDRPGVRSFTSNPYNLVGQQARFSFYLETYNLDEANEIVVESSNNGITWTVLTSTNAEDSYFGNTNGFHSFIIPSVSATTQIRVRQLASNNLAIETSTWYIEDAILELGDPVNIEGAQLVGSYSVSNFTLQTFEILDATDVDITNGTIYPGEQIKVKALIEGFGINDYNYTAVIFDDKGNLYPLSGLSVSKADPEVTITGTVPTSLPFDLTSSYINDVMVLAFSGSVLRMGLWASENDGSLPSTLQGGTYEGGGFKFKQSGERNVTTDALAVNSSTNSFINFYLQRVNNFRSPAGTEIVVEYSTNGTTYTQLQEINLNTLALELTPGVFYENFEIAIPVGAVSNATQFRIRQKDNNGLNLDTWFVDNLEIVVSSNINEDIIEYIESGIDVLVPTLQLSNINVPNALTYPGESLSLTFNVSNGRFPSGTQAQAFLITGGAYNNLVLGATSINNVSTNTINFTVPAIPEDDYQILIKTVSGVNSNSVYLPIYGLDLTIDEVTTADGILEGENNVLYPGSSITVNYSVDGDLPSGIQLDAQVYDYNEAEYVSVASTTTINGNIDLVLPTGIDYNFGVNGNPEGQLDIRLALGEGALSSNSLVQIANTTWDLSLDANFVDASNRQGNYTSDNAYFGIAGVRSAQTIAFDVAHGGLVYLGIVGQNAIINQALKLEGSIDGIVWVSIDEFDFVNGDLSVNYSTIPNNLWSASTRFRFIYNEDGAAGLDQNILQFNAVAIQAYQAQTAAEAFFSTTNILQLSVSQSTIADPNFLLGEQTTIQFNTDGPFPDNTAFAVVLENSLNDDIYSVLGTTENQGAVTLDISLPNYALDINGANLFDQLRIVPYQMANASDTYRRNQFLLLDEAEDFLLVEGENSFNQFGNYNEFSFSKVGSRGLITKAVDLSNAAEAYVNFYIELYGMDVNSNIQTLPRLQVSIDGGVNFTNLATQNGNQLGDGIVYQSNGTIWASIPESFLTTATHFRLYQPLNLGVNSDTWYVKDLEVSIGSSNELDEVFYDNFQNPQTISLSEPSLDNYTWIQQNSATDPIFNGDEFSFSWARYFPELEAYPTGTTFTFKANFTDQETNQAFVLATLNAEGIVETEIPAYTEAGEYNVIVYVSLTEGNNTYTYNYIDDNFDNINDGENVGTFKVYNRVLRTTQVVGNEILYAGGDATFSADFENDVTADDLVYYNTLYFNLLVNFDGKDWLLGVQQGYQNDFTVALPPFITSSSSEEIITELPALAIARLVEFRVEVTEGGPIGVVGEIVQNPTTNLLADNESKERYFVNIHEVIDQLSGNGNATFLDVSGKRQLTTATINTSAIDVLEYTIQFDKDLEEISTNQLIVFEFSDDNGITYSELATYPDVSFENNNTQTFRMVLTAEMQTENVRLRFRQDESNGFLSISNFNLIANDVFPFEVVGTNPEIKTQGISITAVDEANKCFGERITLDYSIFGRFGSENLMKIVCMDQFGDQYDLPNYEFNISEGSGSVDIILPEDFFDANTNNQVLKFGMKSVDYTFENTGSEFGLGYDPIDFEEVIVDGDTIQAPVGNNNYGPVVGLFSESTVEVVSPIVYDAGINYIYGASEFDCGSGERFVKIMVPQNHFRYTIRNKVTGVEITNFIYDPETGVDSVSIGLINSKIEVEVIATALTSDGTLECENQKLINEEGTAFSSLVFDVRPVHTLHYQDNTGVWLPADGLTFEICEATNDFRLATLYFDQDGVPQFGMAKWNRLADPTGFFSEADTLQKFDQSGEYFAEVTTQEGCEYSSASATVNVIDSPSQPTVTAIGATAFCTGNSVTLSGPVGFEFYQWQRNGTVMANSSTSQIVVSTNGIYALSVANTGCFSPVSLELPITVYDIPETVGLWVEGVLVEEGLTFNSCLSEVELFTDALGYPISWTRNGVALANTNPADPRYLNATQSGNYQATIYSDNELTCSISTLSVSLIINPIPAKPAISATLDGAASALSVFEFCNNTQELVLNGPAGFESYQWMVNGSTLTSNSRFIAADRSGNYQLKVGNGTCFSEESSVVQVTLGTLPEIVNLYVEGQLVEPNFNYTTCQKEFELNMDVNPSIYFTRWFRDGVEIANNNSSNPNYLTSNQSGVFQGFVYSKTATTCFVSTLEVTVQLGAIPANPVITSTLDGVVSALTVFEFCDNEQALVLNGPAGFESYQWRVNGTLLNANSRFVTVDRSGNYQLSVGNGTCFSSESSVVQVSLGSLPSSVGLWVDGQEVNPNLIYTTCQAEVELNMNVNPATYITRWFRNGLEIANTNSTAANYLTATQAGIYQGFVYSRTSSNCFINTLTISVVLGVVPASPAINATVDGVASAATVFEICNSTQELILTGPAGFNSYQWMLNGNVLNANSRNLLITESGTYQLSVGNGTCYSAASNVVQASVGQLPTKVNLYVGNTLVEQSNYTACGTEATLRIDADPDDYYIRWFRNGTEVANTNSDNPNFLSINSDGAYFATVYSIDASNCSVSSLTANVTLGTAPARPSITAELDGTVIANTSFEFCDGSASLELSLPSGSTGYRWYKDGALMTGLSDANMITVNQSGSYRVSILNTDLCESERSLPINVIVRTKPTQKSFSAMSNGTICESGTADFEIFGASTAEIYQLYRVVNVQPYQLEVSGNPVIGNATGETIITSAVIAESAEFVLGISNNFSNSCEAIYSTTVEVSVENVTMTVLGNQLTAKLVSGGNIQSYQWLRNDLPINNGGNGSSISVFDDAEYRVNVITSNGCELSISTTELGGGRILGMSQQLRASDITLYPNPSADLVNVKITNGYLGELKLRVISVSGQQMMEQVIEKNSNEYNCQLSIGALKEGLYMLQVISDSHSEMLRIIRK